MATRYAIQQQGVADGSLIPPALADARETMGNKTSLLASKEDGVAWANGDVVYLGFKPAGTKISDIKWNADTSMGSATLDVGVGGDPRAGGTVVTADKYVDGKTVTATNTPTSIGPKASTADDAPGEGEHLWGTIGGADIGAAVLATIDIQLVGIS